MKKLLLLSLFSFAQPAFAQSTAPASPPPAAPPAAAPAPPLVRIYGLLNPRIIYSSAAVESYSQPNATAITAAGNPVYSNRYQDSRFSFQAGQSRFGIWAGEGTPYRGQIEFDFVDFTRPTPTVQSLPRVRIAKVEWYPTPELSIQLGQDWDIIQPINPYGINLVGGAFQAGNTAFMRQQLKAIYKLGDFEVAIATGFPNNNAIGGKDGALELGLIPTGALRLQYTLGKVGKIGISGIAASLLLNPGKNDERAFAGEGGIYGDLTFGPMNLRFEGYIGQNVANLFLLGLGSVRTRNTAAAGETDADFEVIDVQEAGGFISPRIEIVPNLFAIYAQGGIAAVLNPSRVISSYGYPMGVTNPAAATLGANGGGGTGIKRNHVARLGGEFKITKGFNFMIEGFYHHTLHDLNAIDQARQDNPATQDDEDFDNDVVALGVETGFLYLF